MKRVIFIIVVFGMIFLIGCGKAKVYTVTFDANGGSGEMKSQFFAEGVQQALITNTFTREGYLFNGWNVVPDGSGSNYSDAEEIVLIEDIVLYAQWEEGKKVDFNGHAYVDLGLPSGTLWATCNVGATNPEDFGDFFAWGETTPKDIYTSQNYKYYDTVSRIYTKYTSTDGLYILEPIDDAAAANWGGDWRMPDYKDVHELKSNCTFIWTTQNNVQGCQFVGHNGNSIFLPAAGQNYYHVSGVGRDVCYWSSYGQNGSSFSIEIVGGVFYDYAGIGMINNMSERGFSVRPVCSCK